MADFLLVSVDFGGAAAATTCVAISHQRSCPVDHVLQIELGNLAPIGQHRRSRQKRSCARSVVRRPVRIAHISNGLTNDARGQ